MDLSLPTGYTSRPYRGREDHADMARVLGAVRKAATDSEMPTADGFDGTYASFAADECVPTRDAALILTDAGDVVGYARTAREVLVADRARAHWLCFPIIHPDHLAHDLYTAAITSMERHRTTFDVPDPQPDRYLAFTPHPGPGLAAAGPAAWLEDLGYEAFQFGAVLVRPRLDDIPDSPLPDGLEIRAVEPEHLREIWDVHHEAFRGEWDFREPTEAEFEQFCNDPKLDTSLWKIAWDERGVVGQVKSFVNHDENAAEGRLRGYTEYISTRADWRNRGVAAALLCASLRELRDRGMTEAALGADVNNPSAFLLYQRLGFQVTAYEAVYVKPIG